MLRNTFFAVLAVLAAAASSQAAIMLQASDPSPLPMGGLVSYQIRAIGSAGEIINTFSDPSITAMNGGMGVHNVGQAFTNAPTPSKSEHAPGLWHAEWAPYDTHFLFDSTQALAVGGMFTETNNGSTTGMLGLPRLAGQPTDPSSGFGQYSTTANPASRGLTPASGQADSDVPFMQVVMRADDAAMLSLRVVGDGGASVGDFTGANAFQIGGGDPVTPPIIDNVNLGDQTAAIINHTFVPAVNSGPITSWSIAPTTGSPVQAATISPTGMFQWHTTTSARSLEGVPYSWTITATGPDGSDTGVLSLELVIPEPATMSLIGIAMVGLVGFARRRS